MQNTNFLAHFQLSPEEGILNVASKLAQGFPPNLGIR